MNEIQILLNGYVEALRAAEREANDARYHRVLMEHLAATSRMQAALDARDLGRLAAELNEQERLLGWNNLLGDRGAAAHQYFAELKRVTQAVRLEGRPEAW
jgi:hypothetical protein